MSSEPVDVLIVGAGASGAAVAWSLAETRMHIVCMEQGDLMHQDKYPTTGMDWEARGQGDFSFNPNTRQGPADYPINDTESPISPAMFNAVGGSTILWAGHFPRMRPADFRTQSLDGVATDWPIDYATLEPFFACNDGMMGVSGMAG
ncbi:MAG: NAD(P)-binding protein, partial [Halieaceae bacterium]|nr:NAD(P)-binding protein [Halieaceae bacterium]